MRTWIALLRGINVGGKNRLPMRELVQVFQDAGCRDVRTYIQSGNVAFKADIESVEHFTADVSARLLGRHGFSPAVRILSAVALRKVVSANPYPEAVADPASLHVFFLQASPQPPLIDAAKRLLAGGERFTVDDGVLYLHAPDGIGRSRLVSRLDRVLRMETTARNWRTLSKLVELTTRIG